MSTGLCLVTRGMVCNPYEAEVLPLTSCAEPVIQATIEVRPKVRYVAVPTAVAVTPPIPTTATELRPKTRKPKARTTQDPSPRPKPVMARELRPRTKKGDD